MKLKENIMQKIFTWFDKVCMFHCGNRRNDMFDMKKLNLSPEKQNEYDALMAEVKAELDQIPPSDGNSLSCKNGNNPYQEIYAKYQERLAKILEK